MREVLLVTWVVACMHGDMNDERILANVRCRGADYLTPNTLETLVLQSDF